MVFKSSLNNGSGSGGGVSSLNSLTGAVSLTSTGGTVTITPSGATINLEAASGSGNVSGPASSTDNAIARYDLATGKIIQNSGVIIDDSNNVSGIGTLAAGASTITSSSASALTVGLNGATNPALKVDASTALSATGIAIKSAVAGGGVTLTAISSAADENVTLASKGTNGSAALMGGASVSFNVGGGQIFGGSVTQDAFTNFDRSFTSNTGFLFTGIAGTSLTASTESTYTDFNLAANQQHAAGAITTQRDFRIRPSTHSFVGASTITDPVGLAIDGAPIAGTNATLTTSSSLKTYANAVGAATAKSYGGWFLPNTGAAANFAARFDGAIDLNGAGAGTAGQVPTSAGAGAALTWTSIAEQYSFTFGDGTNAIVAGTGFDVWVRVKSAFTITGVELTADASSSAVLDIWVDTYANFPPTVADSIVASAPPTLSSSIKSQDTTLTGWTKIVAAGSYIKVHINSSSTAKRLYLAIYGTKN